MTVPEHEQNMNEWSVVLDKLILGLSHQMSNRVSALTGVSEILVGDPDGASPIVRALSDEVVKLEEAIRLFRLLAAVDDAEDVVEPIRLVDDAIALAGIHPELAGVAYRTDGGDEVPPIVVRPTALTHEILVALVAAADGRRDGTIPVKLSLSGDDVVIQIGSCEMSAPTLAATRRSV